MTLASIVTVSEKGQIAIPADIRRKARIGKGDAFVIVYQDGGILLEPTGNLTEKAREQIRALRDSGWRTLRQVWSDDDGAWSEQLAAAARHRPAGGPIHGSRRQQAAASAHRVQRPAQSRKR